MTRREPTLALVVIFGMLGVGCVGASPTQSPYPSLGSSLGATPLTEPTETLPAVPSTPPTPTAGPSGTPIWAGSPTPTHVHLQASGTFAPTGSMLKALSGATATLLRDGRVLIAGGQGASVTPPGGGTVMTPPTDTAELFDPATGRFSQARPMTTRRGDHTATLLEDGRVLIAGGRASWGGMGGLASAELYDPTTGRFSATGSMSAVRSDHTATLLSDGRVLIAGGSDNNGDLASAELYDPASGTFRPTGSMSTPRYFGQTATLLRDGRVLIAGGETTQESAEVYDPKTGTFTATGSLVSGRFKHTATLLPDGRVLVAGGVESVAGAQLGDEHDDVLASAELYDPASGTFTPTGSMTAARHLEQTATLLQDGRVLVAGGAGSSEEVLASAELYDPASGTFTPTGSMRAARDQGHTATLLQDGRVLIAGGEAAVGSILASAEVFQP